MAPNEAAVRNSYRLATNRLLTACRDLEGHLPPAETEDFLEPPSIWPELRHVGAAVCERCTEELEQLDEAAREEHTCSHQGDNSTAGARPAEGEKTGPKKPVRRRQPNEGVIRSDLQVVDERFEAFVTALSTLSSMLMHQEDEEYQEHLIVWSDYKRWMKDRALDTLDIIAEASGSRETQENPAPNSQDMRVVTTTGVSIEQAVIPQPTPPATGGQMATHSGSLASTLAQGSMSLSGLPCAVSPVSCIGGQQSVASSGVHGSSAAEMTNTTFTQLGAQSLPGSAAFVSQPAGTPFVLPSQANMSLHTVAYRDNAMALALATVNSVQDSIHDDLLSLEQEVAAAESLRGEGYITDLKEACANIEGRVRSEFKLAVENLAKADTGNSVNSSSLLTASTKTYLDRIRVLQQTLRRARSNGTPDSSVRSLHTAASVGPNYKPFLKKLDPPTFSGKVEEWPEFRSVWMELLADLPDNVQVQHFRTNIPANDAKRVAGVKTMTEMWARMEKIYGDVDLNIITIKSNLENLTPKATQEHKRIVEIFEAVEIAVTQLQNLDALHYLLDVLGLINKLILKLPFNT